MPRVVAVIGASTDRAKFGNKAVRAFLNHGDQVVPINPKEDEIEGLPAYPSVRDVPGEIDLAVLCVRSPLVRILCTTTTGAPRRSA